MPVSIPDVEMSEKQGVILVVDDEEMVWNLLRRTLQGADYDVIMAANGQEALDKVSQFNISLVLLDIKMLGLDGFQVLGRIRQRFDIPVMMLTAVKEVAAVRDSFNLGADDYATKPFSKRKFLLRIQAKLRRAQTGP